MSKSTSAQSTALPQASVRRTTPVPGCLGMCCSFLQQEELTNLAEPNLNGAIHPLFQQQAFAEFKDEIKYFTLESALRLSSHLIEATLPFFHTLLFGKFERSPNPNRESPDNWYEISGEEALTTEQLDLTRETLCSLADSKYISFAVNDEEGLMTADPQQPIENDSFFRGHTVQIKLSVDKLYDLEQVYEGNMSSVVGQYHLVNSAVSITHELVHSIALARYRELHSTDGESGKLFFKDSQVAEEGYAWEAYAFGGIISPIPSIRSVAHNPGHFYTVDGQPIPKCRNMFVLHDWPNRNLVNTYEHEDYSIAVRGELSIYYLVWSFSFLHISNMLQDKFWTETVPRFGPKVLHPPKILGYRCRAMFEGGAVPYPAAQRLTTGEIYAWDFQTGVPDGYTITSGGLVHPTEHVDSSSESEEAGGSEFTGDVDGDVEMTDAPDSSVTSGPYLPYDPPKPTFERYYRP